MSDKIAITGVPTPVADEIVALVRVDGSLQVEDVLAAARDEDNALHGYFEWDDTAAAVAYRLEQAGALVRRCKVTFTPRPDMKPVLVRAFIAKRDLPPLDESDIQQGSYRSIETVRGDVEAEDSVKAAIKRDLLRLRSKYSSTEGYFNSVLAEVFS